jgi:glutamine cyclotransferase
MIVDGTNGILRGQLIGSVFADDSTMIIDGTNGNIPGYISVATLKTLASTSATYADFQTAVAAL